jgi:hypothetical protein
MSEDIWEESWEMQEALEQGVLLEFSFWVFSVSENMRELVRAVCRR